MEEDIFIEGFSAPFRPLEIPRWVQLFLDRDLLRGEPGVFGPHDHMPSLRTFVFSPFSLPYLTQETYVPQAMGENHHYYSSLAH